MKSLVTGGAGFIGNHLVARLLELGHEVVVLDNFRRGNKLDKQVERHVSMIVGDVRDEDTVLRAAKGCGLVFHYAAVLGVDAVAEDPVETMDTEVLSVRHIAKAATLNDIEKVLYASTSGVYGSAAIDQAVTEEALVAPKSSYSIAKRYNEFYLESLFRERGLQSVSLRFFNAYGPKQDNRMVVPRFFSQALSGAPVTVYGSGEQTRDFTYIDDVTDAVVALARHSQGCEVYNIANRRERTINDLARTIVAITGSKSDIIHVEMPKQRYEAEVERRFGSSEKLTKVTGFKPSTSLEAGLRRAHEYFLTDGAAEIEQLNYPANWGRWMGAHAHPSAFI